MSEAKIVERLDQIVKLMVFAMTEGKPQTERVRLLSLVGFKPKEIAETLGTTSNTVSVTLLALRRKDRQKGRNT